MNQATREGLFDLSYLNQIFQGNQEMVKNIIRLFLEQVPDYIAEMEDCVVRADLDLLHPLAHKAKSSVAMLGLKKMETNILEIEKNSKYGENTHRLPDLVKEVRKECDLVFSQLEEILEV